MEEPGRSQLEGLIQSLRAQGSLHEPRVEAALRAVPRHLFLPDTPLERVYEDEAIQTKQEGEARSSCSQPTVVVQMLEMLGLQAGESVLEIGAGTGWNAALMASLVGPEGHIVTLEIDEDTTQKTHDNLERAGVTNVEVRCTDGGYGDPRHAPYDALIATAAVEEISPHWLAQLKPTGRLVAPLAYNTIEIVAVFHKENTDSGAPCLVGRNLRHYYFMPLRGAFAGTRTWLRTHGLSLVYDPSFRVEGDTVVRLLRLSSHTVVLPEVQGAETTHFIDYLALRGEPMVTVTLSREAGSETLQGVAWPQSLVLTGVWWDDEARRNAPFTIRVFGDAGGSDRMRTLANEWIDRGRPTIDRAVLTVAPFGALPHHAGAPSVRKHWMEYRVVFD